MIVGDVMVPNPITIKLSDTLLKAQDLMVKNSIRHLPVVDGKEMHGIISESDIRSAFIGSAQAPKGGTTSSLDPAKMKVHDFMTRNPLTVMPETHIEDAALLIYKNKIGALPVVEDNKLVGILSVMDITGLFIDMMGLLHSSSRVDVVMGKDEKNLKKVSKIIKDQNLNIISVSMLPYSKDDSKQVYAFRLDLCDTHAVVEEIEKAGYKILSAME